MNNKRTSLKNFLIGYSATAVLMVTIFLITMLVQNTAIDYKYLGYALSHISWLAIPSGFLVMVLENKNLLIRIIAGSGFGFLSAVIFVWFNI